MDSFSDSIEAKKLKLDFRFHCPSNNKKPKRKKDIPVEQQVDSGTSFFVDEKLKREQDENDKKWE